MSLTYTDVVPVAGSGDDYLILQPKGRIRLSTQLRTSLFKGAEHVSIKLGKDSKSEVVKQVVIIPLDFVSVEDRKELQGNENKNTIRYFAINGTGESKSYIINANKAIDVIQPEPVTFKVLAKEGDDEETAVETKGNKYRMRRYQEFAIHYDHNAHKEFGKCVVVDVNDYIEDKVRYFDAGGKHISTKRCSEISEGH